MMLLFLVKFPVFCFHLWLPKAHVESPTIGSMLLAGVLLKLGTHGSCRFMIHFKIYFHYYDVLIVVGFVLASMFISTKQMDYKLLVAYNSVSHINIMLLVIVVGVHLSKDASAIMALTHGILAAMMFHFYGDVYFICMTRIILIIQNNNCCGSFLSGTLE